VYRVEDTGSTAEPERNMFRRSTRARAQQVASDRLRQTGLHGTAQIRTSDLAVTDGPFTGSMQGTFEHLVWPDGTTAVPALTSLSGGIATQVQTWLAEPVRTQPYVCIGGDFDETAQITLPANVRVTDLPRDATVRAPSFDYASHYVFDPATRTLQVTRRLHAAFGHQVCSPEEFAQARAALERIERDAFSEVVVKAGGGAG
jgi:hypothetical protein